MIGAVADVEDNWPTSENAPRRKSAPNEHQKLLTVEPTVGRSNSFKMLKSTTNRLSPDSAQGHRRRHHHHRHIRQNIFYNIYL